MFREFPGSPVFRTPCFYREGLSSVADGGTTIPQACSITKKKNLKLVFKKSLKASFDV